MEIHHPNALLHLFWLLPVLILLVWRASRLRRRRLRTLVADHHSETNASPGRRRWRHSFLLTGTALMIVAAARPQWGTELVQRPVQARDLLVVLDCSRSMLAQDVAPSRLRHAKLLVRRLVSQSPGDRFGLVAFAGASFLECPLTQDRSGFLLFLDDVSTSTIPVGGTNVEDALKTALEGFEAAEGRHRAILLITDGDQLTGDFRQQVAACREANVKVFAVGLGDPEMGSFLQLSDNSFVTDENGERVRSKLNEAALHDLAAQTEGYYLRSTPVHDGLDQLQAQIQALIPEGKAEQTVARPMERYQAPLLAAFLLLLIRIGTSETRTALALLLAFASTALSSRAADSPAPPPASVAKAGTPLESAYAWYNEGVRMRQEGDADGARRAFEEAATLAGGEEDLSAAVLQNLGALDHERGREQMLAAAMSGKEEPPAELAAAASLYRRALKAGAPPADAGGNLEQALLDTRRYHAIQQLMKEMQEQQQQARDDVEQAANQQQQAAESPNDARLQQSANQKTEKARQSVQELADKLRQNGADDTAEMLEEQVKKHLDDAKQAQRNASREDTAEGRRQQQESAANSLREALAQMGGQEQPEPGSDNGDESRDGDDPDDQQTADNDQDGNGDQQDGNDPGDSSEQDQQAQQSNENLNQPGSESGNQAAQGMATTNEALDKEQALRILEANQRRERDLKRLLKERMKQAAAAGKVERDW